MYVCVRVCVCVCVGEQRSVEEVWRQTHHRHSNHRGETLRHLPLKVFSVVHCVCGRSWPVLLGLVSPSLSRSFCLCVSGRWVLLELQWELPWWVNFHPHDPFIFRIDVLFSKLCAANKGISQSQRLCDIRLLLSSRSLHGQHLVCCERNFRLWRIKNPSLLETTQY